MEALIAELKQRIVDHLDLDDVDPSAVGDDEPLFGDGLGLDSIDAVELVALLEKSYGIKIVEMETAKAAFRSPRTLADFVAAHRRGGAG